ncbi:PspC domain-containing protein [Nocardioides marmorisolisilvae]|nr:PspC domain-containing protein [Nocardioides marmorisolisilvae]
MNETTTDPGTPPGPAPSGFPRPRPSTQDLDRLRRSVDDRYIAGVAGGLGRHFGIDPTVIRVLLAVLTFFGGAGVLIYAACWMFVPEEGNERAPIHVSNEPRKLLILAAVGVGLLLAMGDAFSGGFHTGWSVASLIVIIAIVLIFRDRTDGRKAFRIAQKQAWAEHRARVAAGLAPAYEGAPFTPPATPPTTAPYTPPTANPAEAYATEATTVLPDYATIPPTPPAPPAPPSWQPPQPAYIPPRPKRTGILWFWPTLAMIAIALGVVGVYDGSHHVDGGVYPAVAVAITGVMLLVGSFVGRPGGLFLIGLVSSAALAISAATGGFDFSGQDLEVTPKTAADVQPTYHGTNGQVTLDLTEVSDPQNLAGRTLKVTIKAGEIRVLLPRTVNADVNADFSFAGGIDIPGYSGGGIQDSAERQLVGAKAGKAAPIKLDLHATMGHIEVEVENR